ncbi:MAG: hypothetical protein GC202_02240 [Alphaproteobacteria bacterium]|nr:hypothetical protein [Alphaproteobacteria bacterium]
MAVLRKKEALIEGAEPWAQTADAAALSNNKYLGRAARSELALRNAMENVLRGRMPDARMCHEMVMGEGRVRADLVAVGTDHIVAVEVKGRYDDTSRLLHQVGMYQLCVPEVWMVVTEHHGDDARLIRWLLPSVGLMVCGNEKFDLEWEAKNSPDLRVDLRIEHEPVPRDPIPEMMMRICWAAELEAICTRLKISVGSRPVRKHMVSELSRLAQPIELRREICTALRAREALWRADPAR